MSIETPAVFWYDGKSIIGNIFFKLLPFLANPSFSALQKTLLDTTSCLLTLLLSGNLAAYRSFVKDTLQLLSNLGQILQYFQENKNLESFNQPIIIKCYESFNQSFILSQQQEINKKNEDSDEDVMQDIKEIDDNNNNHQTNESEDYFLPISKIQQCVCCIESLTKLLSTQIERVPQFLEDICSPLWSNLLLQIERGDSKIKQVSLESLRIFLDVSVLPTYLHSSYLMTLISLIHPRNHHLRNIEETEINLSQCIIKIINISANETIQLFSVEFFKNLPEILSQNHTLSNILKETLGYLIYTITSANPTMFSKISMCFGCKIISPFIINSFIKYLNPKNTKSSSGSSSSLLLPYNDKKDINPPSKRRKLDFGDQYFAPTTDQAAQPNHFVQNLFNSIPIETFKLSINDNLNDILFILTTIRSLLFISKELESSEFFKSILNQFLTFLPNLSTIQIQKTENKNDQSNTHSMSKEELERIQKEKEKNLIIYENCLIIVCDLLCFPDSFISSNSQNILYDSAILFSSLPFTLSWDSKSKNDLEPFYELKLSIVLRSLEIICSLPQHLAEKSQNLYVRCLKSNNEEIQVHALTLLSSFIKAIKKFPIKILLTLQNLIEPQLLSNKKELLKNLSGNIGIIACLHSNPEISMHLVPNNNFNNTISGNNSENQSDVNNNEPPVIILNNYNDNFLFSQLRILPCTLSFCLQKYIPTCTCSNPRITITKSSIIREENLNLLKKSSGSFQNNNNDHTNNENINNYEENYENRGTINDFDKNWKKFFWFHSIDCSTEIREIFIKESLGRIAWHCKINDIKDNESFWRDKLSLLMDDDVTIRRAMVGTIKYYTLPPMSNIYCSDNDKYHNHHQQQFQMNTNHESWILFTEINKFLQEEVKKNDFELLSSILSALGEIGSYVENEFLSVITLTLVENLVSSQRDVRALAFDQLRFIASHKNLTVKELAEQFQEHIDPFLISKLKNPDLVDEAASALYDITDFNKWLISTLPITLPRLFTKLPTLSCEIHEFSPVEKLAQILETSVANLLDDYIHYVVPYVLIIHPKEEMKNILQIIVKSSKYPKFKSLIIGANEIKVVTEIILMLYHEDEVIKSRAKTALDIVYKTTHDEKSPPSSPNNNQNQNQNQIKDNDTSGNNSLSDYLSSIFFNLTCNTIHPKMQNKDVKFKERLQMLRSFDELMKLLGSNLYSLRPKIMTTLKLFSQQPALAKYSCLAWKTFICELDPNQLGPILSQVIAEILPFIDSAPCEVFLIFEYFKNQRETLQNYLESVPYIPDVPLLSTIRPFLVPNEKSYDINIKLSQLLCGLKHKSEAVQKQAVEQLIVVLYENRDQLNEILLKPPTNQNFQQQEINSNPNSNSNDSSSQKQQKQLIENGEFISLDCYFHILMKQLLEGCINASNSNVKILYGKALGELGAIDPIRICEINLKPVVEEKTNEIELAIVLIENFLVNHLRAADDPIAQNKIGFALQELLKICGCTLYISHSQQQQKTTKKLSKNEKELKKNGEKTWNQFPFDVQEILRPFLHSFFELKGGGSGSEKNYQSFCQKILNTNPKNAFRRWIGDWSVSLISKTNGKNNKIFRACRGAVKHNVDIALYLLPYLLLDVLVSGSNDDRESIKQEIMDVLQLGRKVEASPSRIMDGESSPLIQMCMQTIFSMIDILTRWVDQQKLTFSRGGRKSKLLHNSTSSHCHIEKLLEEVPNSVLANASFQSRAFPRSLFHYEKYIRNERKNLTKNEKLIHVFTRSRIEDLEKIYSEIDEPDGLSGIETIRSLVMERDSIREYENLGRWSDAFANYDHHLQEDPNSLQHQIGRLRCLQNLGHLETMLSLVFIPKPSSLLRNSDITKSNSLLAPYGIKSAWRLGKWDVVERYIPYINQTTKEFDVSVGKLLFSFLKQQNQTQNNKIQHLNSCFKNELNATALNVVQSLSAASMESYKRAYPYIVQLHTLKEIEDYFNLLQSENNENNNKKMKKNIPRNHHNNSKIIITGIEKQKRKMIDDWKKRIHILSPSLRIRDVLLHFHQIICFGENFYDESQLCWLQMAYLARKEKQYDIASCALTKAYSIETQFQLKNNHDEIQIQLAKLQWIKENHLDALLIIQNITSKYLNITSNTNTNTNTNSKLNDDQRFKIAKFLLLEGKWLEKTGQKQHDEVIQHYKKAIELCPSWEKSYLVLGKYYDALLQAGQQYSSSSLSYNPAISAQVNIDINQFNSAAPTYETRGCTGKKTPELFLSYLSNSIKNYGTSLKYGHKYIYQSLPRLLTLWLDDGSIVSQFLKNYKSLVDKEIDSVRKIMNAFQKSFPNYLWLTCFPQIVSSICNTHHIFIILEKIIYSVLVEYPQQSFWAIVAVSKSTDKERNKRASDIIAKAKKTSQEMKDFLETASQLCQYLLSICNYKITNQSSLSIKNNRDFRNLLKLVPLNIIVPLQSSLTVTLPPIIENTYNNYLKSSTSSEILNPNYENNKKTGSKNNIVNNQLKFKPFPENLVTIHQFHDNIEIMSSLIKPRKITIIGSDGDDYMFLCKPRDDLRKDARMMDFNNILNKLLRKNAESRKRQLHIRTYGVIPLNETCGLIEWVQNTSGYRHILTKLLNQHKVNALGNTDIKKMYSNSKMDPLTRFQTLCDNFHPIFYKWFIQEFPEPSAWFAARLAFSRTAAVMSMVGHIVGLGDRHGENILLDELTGEVVHIDLNCLFWKGQTFQEPEVVPFRLTPHMVDALGVTGYDGVFRRVCEITLGVLRSNRDTLMSVLQPLIDDPLVEATSKSSKIKGPKSDFMQAINAINKLLKGQFGLLPLSVEGHVHKLLEEATDELNLCKVCIN